MLTQAELNAIKERAEKATEGWVNVDGIYVVTLDEKGDARIVAECDNEDNAYFIGEARQDVPKLLNEIKHRDEKISRQACELDRIINLLDDAFGILSEDDFYRNHSTTLEIAEYFNVNGERDDE
jgi:hypothetical protein